ncbi:MAG: alpha/beta hydrolase [Thermoanaerobaculales bacterium]|jgi:pimeloyl-ACP methyl ester carboxylesterase|nr:alpha/beta hydrolase [Thermoanaerobaculales bacterium]
MKQRLELRLVLSVATAAVLVLAVLAIGCAEQQQPPQTAEEEAKPMNATNRHFFNTQFGDVHYTDVGSSETPPVILLHQTPRSIDEFAEVIPLLAAEHRVVAMDNPGYGCSDIPPRQPTVEEYADTVVELMDHLEISKAVLVGHHTGGILAIDIAARYPDRVDRLALSGPHYMDAEMREMLLKISKQWTVQPDGSHMQEKWDKFSGWVDDPMIVHRVVTDLLRAGETSEYGHFSCADYLMENTLPKVNVPTLLIVGKNDFFANTPKNNIFEEIIPDNTKVMIEGGIFLPTESPEPFAEVVLEFLREEG